jgi:hypothetical protein
MIFHDFLVNISKIEPFEWRVSITFFSDFKVESCKIFFALHCRIR